MILFKSVLLVSVVALFLLRATSCLLMLPFESTSASID